MNIPKSILLPLSWQSLKRRKGHLGIGGSNGLIRLSRTVRLTREGKWYILFVLVTGAVAINTGNNLLYLVLATLLSLIIISGLMSEFTMRGLDIEREQPRNIFKGVPFSSRLQIRNRKKMIPSISFRLYELSCRGMDSRYSYIVKAAAGEELTVTATRTCNMRGLTELKGFKISTTFPFGLFLKTKIITSPAKIIVYPQIKPLKDVRLSSGMLSSSGESRPTRGSGSELYNIRPYTESDDARHIHWKSAARGGSLMVKEFEQEVQRSVIVSFQNLCLEEDREAFEDKVDETAGVIDLFLERGFSVALETLSGNIADGSGKAHLYRVLEFLALIAPAGQGEPSIKVRQA
ncbi:MAG: DUF58 domain-containing protein [Thermodesulfobacteriota bacterium]